MRIESLRIKNYKLFQEVLIENIPSFAVFVGANGTGKTTLFDVFGFLRDCLNNNVRQALDARGGWKETVSRGHEKEDIEIEIKFPLMITGKERLVTYSLQIGERRGKGYVKREILRYKRGSFGSPYHFLDFEDGQGYAITNEEDFDKTEETLNKERQVLENSEILAIKGLGQFKRFRAANAFRQMIESWHVSDFHISAARGLKELEYAEHLSTRGENLQQVALYMYENHPEIFKKILDKMCRRVPGVTEVQAKQTDDNRLLLKFRDGAFQDPFIDRYVSDGTIKMFAYLLLLHDPKPHPLLCVEEPENQLYPRLMEELAEEFRLYGQKGQVMTSTHSPDFLNALRVEEVFWLVKKDGFTTINRAIEDKQIRAYMEDGDKMGYLWKQGFFLGVDP